MIIFIIHINIYSEIKFSNDIESISINLTQYFDLSDLEYDDSPYPGRTNIGHLLIPTLLIKTKYLDLNLGGWYKHVYIQFDNDSSPEKLYPYMNAIFCPSKDLDFVIGNFENLFSFPNTIYNEFLFFEERPVSSGLKLSLKRESFMLVSYLDWLEHDTADHPEEFITGLSVSHNLSQNLYYNFYNHYHHRGGQLHKDTHPVRIEQDIATCPIIGFKFKGLYTEMGYYLNTFSQNFKASKYGNAASFLVGFELGKKLSLSYLCWYNYDYYHQDAHIFYLKRKNILSRLRVDYNIFKYKKILDLYFTANLYGVDPPGIDLRFFGKIDLNLVEFENYVERESNFTFGRKIFL